MTTRSLTITAALLLAWLSGGGSQNGLAANTAGAGNMEAAVKIDNFSFTPALVTVPVGTTIRWTNRDDIPHTVVADDTSFKSKALDTDEEFTYTFTKPGTYGYFCSLHPKMTAKIVVE